MGSILDDLLDIVEREAHGRPSGPKVRQAPRTVTSRNSSKRSVPANGLMRAMAVRLRRSRRV